VFAFSLLIFTAFGAIGCNTLYWSPSKEYIRTVLLLFLVLKVALYPINSNSALHHLIYSDRVVVVTYLNLESNSNPRIDIPTPLLAIHIGSVHTKKSQYLAELNLALRPH
jgi:hypothetical protein